MARTFSTFTTQPISSICARACVCSTQRDTMRSEYRSLTSSAFPGLLSNVNLQCLTMHRYTKTSPTAFVSRLITRSLHLLSLKISGYLSISTAPVLKHWASAKVSQAKGGSAEDDARLCEVIVSRLKGQADVGCADVARTAWEKGQPGLASKVFLLDLIAVGQR